MKHFFSIPGLGMWPLVNAVHSHREELQYVSGLNESAVSLIAEGYAHASRKPAFLNLYHSSGTAFGMVAMSIAWADRAPLIFSTTVNSRTNNGRDTYAADPKAITHVTEQYTKWSYEVPLAERIPEAIERAVHIATSPPMGPVHLAFPMDLYLEETDEVKLDTRRHTARIYSSTPEPEGVRKTADLLLAAEMPLIMAGAEVGQYDAIQEIAALAEMLGAPVVLQNGRSPFLPFPTDGKLLAGKLLDNIDLVRRADVILYVGFEATEVEFDPSYPFRNTNQLIIHVSTTIRDVAKQFTPSISLVGNPKVFLTQLNGQIAERTGSARKSSLWMQSSSEWSRKTARKVDRMREAVRDSGGAAVEELVSILKKEYGQSLTIVDHSYGSGPPFVGLLDLRSKDDYFSISQKASTEGWGLPAAIGAQLALPERQVISMVSDGSLMFTSSALYTAARHRVPLIIMLFDNGGWGAGQWRNSFKDGNEGDLNVGAFSDVPIDFVKHAESMGVPAFRVERREQLAAAVEKLRVKGKPFLFDFVMSPISKTQGQEGLVSGMYP